MNLNTALKRADVGSYAAVKNAQDAGETFRVGELVEFWSPWTNHLMWKRGIVTEVEGGLVRVKYRGPKGWARELWRRHRNDEYNEVRKVRSAPHLSE
jgi:hypothetical protein